MPETVAKWSQVRLASRQWSGLDELLHGEVFHSLTEARVLIAQWVDEYNTVRPHRALAMRTPYDFANDFIP